MSLHCDEAFLYICGIDRPTAVVGSQDFQVPNLSLKGDSKMNYQRHVSDTILIHSPLLNISCKWNVNVVIGQYYYISIDNFLFFTLF